MRPVICVTEFCELTLEAAKAAAVIAQCWGEHVVLVRSVDEREQFAYELRSRLIHQDWRRLAREAQELRQHGFDFEEKVLRGMPEDGITGFAWKSGARLIVVGCRPSARIEHWALGCMAEELSETSLVPVLAVRSAGPFERWLAGDRPLNVFVAVDPAARPDAMLNRIDELRGMSRCTMNAAIVSYPENKSEPAAPEPPSPEQHPFGGDTDVRKLMAEEFASRGVPVRELIGRRDIASALVHDAAEAGADVLVITSHPGTDLALLPHRRLATDVLRHAPMSILCIPEPAIEPPRHPASTHHELEDRRHRLGHRTYEPLPRTHTTR